MNETLELGFEVSKLLAHSGYPADAPAFSITWGQIAEAIAQDVIAHNLAQHQLSEETVVVLAGKIQQDLKQMDYAGLAGDCAGPGDDQPGHQPGPLGTRLRTG